MQTELLGGFPEKLLWKGVDSLGTAFLFLLLTFSCVKHRCSDWSCSFETKIKRISETVLTSVSWIFLCEEKHQLLILTSQCLLRFSVTHKHGLLTGPVFRKVIDFSVSFYLALSLNLSLLIIYLVLLGFWCIMHK